VWDDTAIATPALLPHVALTAWNPKARDGRRTVLTTRDLPARDS
jgi:hypothetical protein